MQLAPDPAWEVVRRNGNPLLGRAPLDEVAKLLKVAGCGVIASGFDGAPHPFQYVAPRHGRGDAAVAEAGDRLR